MASGAPLLQESNDLSQWGEGEQEDLSYWGQARLPSWILDWTLRCILEKDGDKVPIDLNRTAGPAVLWGFSALMGLTYYLAALPVVGTYIARCPSDPKSSEFANYPEVLLWIIFFVPLAIIVLVAQWKVCRFLLPPMIQQIRQHKVDGLGSGPFFLWFAIQGLLTIFNLLDQMTNALFTAKTWATRHCYGYQFIQHVWQETISQSMAARLIMLDKLDLDFAEFTMVSYMAQLIVQPILALSYSMPLWGYTVDYNVKEEKEDPVAQYKTFSDNWWNPKDLTDHGSAAVVLAEVNRMEAVVAHDLVYRRALVEHSKIQLRKKLEGLESFKERLVAEEEMLDRCLEIALACTGRGIARFFCKGLLQNAVQVNLQVSMAAISKTVLHGGIDLFNAFTIGVTILSMFMDAPDIVGVFRFASKVLNGVTTHLEDPEWRAKYHGMDAETSELEAGVYRKVWSLRRRLFRLKIYALLYAGMAFLAMGKLVFAVFICDYGTWNLTDLHNGHWGCADVMPDLNVTACPAAEYMCST